MKRRNILLSAFILSLVAGAIAACGESDSHDNIAGALKIRPVKSTNAIHESSKIAQESLNAFVKGQYDLNFELIRKSGDQIGQNNAMISTFSIQSAMGMLYAGAAGTTADEIRSTMHFTDDVHPALNKLNELVIAGNRDAVDSEYQKLDPIEVNITNDLYFAPGYQWKASWLDLLMKDYNAGLTEINFAADPEAARKYINDIVSKDTHERIKDLIPPNGILPTTVNVLTNAIYLKAPWADDFHKASSNLTFTKADSSKVDVDYIYDESRYNYFASDQYQAITVPLRELTFGVMFILPAEGEFDSVSLAMGGDDIDNIFANVSSQNVHLSIPMFTFETSLKLKAPMQALGMNAAFGNADFSPMTEEPNQFKVDEIYHKSFIGLDENGLEAAAATAIVDVSNSANAPEEQTIYLTFNRPFYFVIYESKSHSPLFVGRVMDPSANRLSD